jgi:hypothetical protein
MFCCLFIETHRLYPCTKAEHALGFTFDQNQIFETVSKNIVVYSTGKASEQPERYVRPALPSADSSCYRIVERAKFGFPPLS